VRKEEDNDVDHGKILMMCLTVSEGAKTTVTELRKVIESVNPILLDTFGVSGFSTR